MTDDRGRRGPRLPLRHRAQRQHVRRPPARPPRRRARPAGRDEGAPDARLPHRGRADRRPRRARAPGRRGRAARRTRSATCSPATASPTRSATTSAPPRSSASRAVPTFVVDRALGASGAQPPEALLELLRQGWAAQPAGADRHRRRHLRRRRLLARAGPEHRPHPLAHEAQDVRVAQVVVAEDEEEEPE